MGRHDEPFPSAEDNESSKNKEVTILKIGFKNSFSWKELSIILKL